MKAIKLSKSRSWVGFWVLKNARNWKQKSYDVLQSIIKLRAQRIWSFNTEQQTNKTNKWFNVNTQLNRNIVKCDIPSENKYKVTVQTIAIFFLWTFQTFLPVWWFWSINQKMKLLESSRFEALNSALSFETGDSKIAARIESYSCKMIGSEKALYKKWNGTGESREYEALSPPGQNFMGTSPSYMRNVSWSSEEEDSSDVGNGSLNSSAVLCDVISRKTLFHLISTLNAAFPDYDFSDARGSEFSKEPSFQTVINSVDNLLSVTAMDQYAKVRHALWFTMNEEIDLPNCDIFSYTPDLTSDPFTEEGSLWSFNYFFFNRKKKRVVLFTCQAQSPFSNQSWYDSPSNIDIDEFEDWTEH